MKIHLITLSIKLLHKCSTWNVVLPWYNSLTSICFNFCEILAINQVIVVKNMFIIFNLFFLHINFLKHLIKIKLWKRFFIQRKVLLNFCSLLKNYKHLKVIDIKSTFHMQAKKKQEMTRDSPSYPRYPGDRPSALECRGRILASRDLRRWAGIVR